MNNINEMSVFELQECIKKLQLENENLKDKKEYGLVWELKEEDKENLNPTNYPYLINLNKNIITDINKPNNLLLQGDNLDSLKVLKYTHTNKIHVIYIDPPYNTGNGDFIYNDKYIDSEDNYKHSKWLDFMYSRLILAKDLLANDGVIFISIDNNEFAQLKLLCDSIFDERNFVTDIIVELTKTQGMKVKTAKEGGLVKNYEHVLVYSNSSRGKKIVKNLLYDKAKNFDTHYKIVIEKVDNEFVCYNLLDYIKNNTNFEELFIKYDLKYTINNIDIMMDISPTFYDYITRKISHKLFRTSMISSNEIQNLDIEPDKPTIYGKYLLIKSGNSKINQLQSLLDSLNYDDEYNPRYGRVTIRGDLWKGFYSDMMNIAKEGGVEFKNGKKPVRLIKQLIKMSSDENAIVLDFFAGSGTTGHAVLELNKEDGGNRQFILCTNNENNICDEVTYKRLNNVINGYSTPKGKKIEGLGGNLQYLKIKHLSKENKTNREFSKEFINYVSSILSIKENIFNEVFSCDSYSVYQEKDKTMIISKKGFEKELTSIKEILDNSNSKTKIFYYNNPTNKECIYFNDDTILQKPIPKEILNTYENIKIDLISK